MTFDEAVATEKRVRMKTWPEGQFMQVFITGHVYNTETKKIEKTGPAGKVYCVRKPGAPLETIVEVSQEWMWGDWELFNKI